MPLKASDGFPLLMRRVTSVICVILLTLLVSGGSSVLAAALCPNMQSLSCCMKTKHEAMPSHEAMEGMAMDDAGVMPVADVEAVSMSQRATPCAHCFSPADLAIKSAVIANPAQASKRNLSGAMLARALESLPASDSPFVSIISLRQHAPPGASSARHVLINVLLI